MSDPSAAMPALDALAYASLSDAGRVRTENQDAAEVVQNTSGERMLVVADGMGGHLGGETASRMCLDLLERSFRDPHGSPEERLRRGLVLANEEIYSHALANPELRGMGTTAVVLLLAPGGAGWVAWVGDSRAYRLRGGVLEALTRDHSLMAEWISLGVLTLEAAETHPRRHELTRALGQSPDVAVDVVQIELRPGDRYLLCSDGLHGYVPERALRAVLAEGAAEECACTLVERANANGGSDNVSVVVAVVPRADAPAVVSAAEAPTEPILPPGVEADAPEIAPLPEDVGAFELPPELPPAPVAPVVDAEPEPTGSLTLAELSFGEALAAPEPELELAPATAPASDAPAPDPTESFAFGEISFEDVMAQELDVATPEPAISIAAPPPEPVAAEEPAPPRFVPLLDPPPARAIHIPLMTPVRSRSALDARSMAAGAGVALLVGALAAGVWLYTGERQAPAPAPTVAHLPAPARVPAAQPQPVRVVPPAAVVAPVAPPASFAPIVPPLPARPELAEVAPTPHAKLPEPVPAPVPTPEPPPAAPAAPTPTPPPAAPAPAATTPGEVATSADFELPAPVTRFVDDWLRAVSTHDAALLGTLGLRGVPDDLAGSFATRDAYRLVAASVDEERSQKGRYFVRVVVSYAFKDASGRFRTQDEQRWILRGDGESLRYEGRWQQ